MHDDTTQVRAERDEGMALPAKAHAALVLARELLDARVAATGADGDGDATRTLRFSVLNDRASDRANDSG